MDIKGLTLVSVQDGYVEWEDGDAEVAWTTVGPLFYSVVLREDFDLESAWYAAKRAHRDAIHAGTIPWAPHPDREAFVAQVRQSIVGGHDLEIVWCENCEEPTNLDDATVVNEGYYACSSCLEETYRCCDDCGNYVHYDLTLYTLSDATVCNRCADDYSFCDECDGYYSRDYADEHTHGGCDCESPAQHFTMHNGDSVITQDERITMSLPAGVISDEGMHQIASLVRSLMSEIPVPNYLTTSAAEYDAAYEARSKWHYLANDVLKMDARWQTKDGNFTKRLSKLAHKTQGLKIPPALLTRVGNIARDNSNGANVSIEVTRNLNMSAADFYHEDSCWWQSYSESRCALKSNGGIGLRSFEAPDKWGTVQVSGRAWIMPLRQTKDGLIATFDAMTADAFVVFNGYGDLSGYTPARIVAQMHGLSYAKIGFRCAPMYVNGDSGYLVASEEIINRQTTAGGLSLDVGTHSDLHGREQRAEADAQLRQLVTV